MCCSTPCAEAEKDRPTILSRMEEKERAKNRLSNHHRPGRSGQRQKWKGSALKRDATARAGANAKIQLIVEGTGSPGVLGYLRSLAVRGEGASREGKASLSGPVTLAGDREPRTHLRSWISACCTGDGQTPMVAANTKWTLGVTFVVRVYPTLSQRRVDLTLSKMWFIDTSGSRRCFQGDHAQTCPFHPLFGRNCPTVTVAVPSTHFENQEGAALGPGCGAWTTQTNLDFFQPGTQPASVAAAGEIQQSTATLITPVNF
jgi:hypothetical protein